MRRDRHPSSYAMGQAEDTVVLPWLTEPHNPSPSSQGKQGNLMRASMRQVSAEPW